MNEQPRLVNLTEILDETQLADVQSIVNQVRAGSTRLDSLRFYLQAQEKSLSAKDVDPNYLFYALGYHLNLF